MILAMIFDLDGTLVQTEELKAQSYARAAVQLCPYEVTEAQVIDYFKEVVGLSRQEVAAALLTRFHLTEAAAALMTDYGVMTPWQAFVQLRLSIYDRMLDDPDLLRENQWRHNVALLHTARDAFCKVGLATMSYCPQVQRVLSILNLSGEFDFVATRDDVEHGKPNPEIYHLVARSLEMPPENCLVIEDSAVGVEAALNAGMACVAVSTPFTQEKLHSSKLIDKRWIVDMPDMLPEVVKRCVTEHVKS